MRARWQERWRARLVALRYLLATAWPIVLISALGLVVAYQFVEPAPPHRMTFSAGGEAGAYMADARRYAAVLAAKGITLDVQTSAGSYQNLERLTSGEADAAFVQGGVLAARAAGATDDAEADGEGQAKGGSGLRSLGSVAYEPLWVFYRGEQRVSTLYQLAGRRIAIGEEGSGARGLALQLLAANAIAADSPELLPLAGRAAASALQKGEIDAAIIVAAYAAPVVQELLASPGLNVVSFSQADAYLRRYPYLAKVVLPRGVVDLVRNVPPHDTVLLATTANVIVRPDLHPALVSLLLQAMSRVNGPGGFFQSAGEFPAYRDHSFPLAPEAERYFKSGPPFLQRYLPFWLAVLVDRLLVMILPLIVVSLPLLKFAPTIYTWRVRSKIFRCYGDLKFLENELRRDYDAHRHEQYRERLAAIEDTASTLDIPLGFSDLLYTLRVHINLVREELERLGTRPATAPAKDPQP